MNGMRALLLAGEESCLSLDRKVLRRLGADISHFFSSGRKALDYLASHAQASAAADINMLVCNERLEDMTGLQFLSALRSHQALKTMPALFLVGNQASATAIAAKASNSCSVLARPYTPDQAEVALALAQTPETLHAPLVLPSSFIDSFGARRARGKSDTPLLRGRNAPKTPQSAGELRLREGLAAMKSGNWAEAGRLLLASFTEDPERVETSLALSRVCSCLNKEGEELQWLSRAVGLCLKRGEGSRAAQLINRLPRGKEGQTPLLHEAGMFLRIGETKAAALSFLEAHKLEPSQPLHALIGRTCLFTPAPEEHMRGLVKAFVNTGHDATAAKLQAQLLQPAKNREEEQGGFFDRFPLLGDIVSVAAFTFKTWRQAA
ncbi:response regulator [Deltaproteobacteria bacterium]|nr:response regulator [Deltaproteobacteria bacterium]